MLASYQMSFFMLMVDFAHVCELLQANFNTWLTTVSLIGAGMFSKTFSF